MSLFASTLSLLALVSSTSSALTPVAPGPGDIFHAGSNCTIVWNADSTGTWKNLSIDLMTGSNNAMVLVTNVVAGLDGTSTELSPYNWTCPDVEPHSAIYFYEFNNGGNTSEAQWTTRFTIASSSGDTTPPDNSTQPNGNAIPWGIGRLASNSSTSGLAAQAVTPPMPNTTATQSFATEQSGPTDAIQGSGAPGESAADDASSHHRGTRTWSRTRHATKTHDASAQADSANTVAADSTTPSLQATRKTRHSSTDHSHPSAATLELPPAATSDGRVSSEGRTMVHSGARRRGGRPSVSLALLSVFVFL